MMDKHKEKYIIIAAAFLFIITAMLIHLMNPAPLFNTQPYMHAKSASLILENNFHFTDKIKVHGNIYALTPYDYILAFFAKIIGVEAASNVLPLLTGILTIFIFYMMLHKLITDENLKLTGTLLLLVSPAFMFNHIISQPYTILVPLILSTFYFLTCKNASRYIAIPLAAFTAFLNPLLLIITKIPFSVYLYFKKNLASRNLFLITFIIAMLTVIVRFYTFPHFNILLSPEKGFLINNINFFGSIIGFSLFAVIVGFTGLLNTWPRKRHNFPLYIALLILILSSIIFPGHKTLLNLILAVLAAKGLLLLLNMNWELKILREISTIIIITGLIFSSGLYFNTLNESSPSPELVSTLKFLKTNSYEHEVVLSHSKNKFWTEYFSDTKQYSPKNRSIYKTREEDRALEFFRENNISYVLVDKPTRELMFNKENNKGLEFVMENSDRFKKLRSHENIALWASVPANS